MDIATPQMPFIFASTATNLSAQCLANNLPQPSLFGAEILSVTSSLVSNYTASFPPPDFTNSDPPSYGAATDLSFCNITVAYTHPSQNDTINVNLWLPVSVSESASASATANATTPDDWTAAPAPVPVPLTTPAWNGRFLSLGGGGYVMGPPDIDAHVSLTQGYAISSTDGGHSRTVGSSEPWALVSPGNVNLYLLQDFASVALHDMAVIGKEIVKSFYGVAPSYSYFKGCSTGGRQGLMLAQRYPDDYDGILAAAPAIYFPKLLMSHYWAQVVMNQLGKYPHGCELDAINAALVDECDDLDGVRDGVVAAVDACHFDPFKLVGTSISCTERYADADAHGEPVAHSLNISHAAAHVALSVWRGPVDADSSNTTLWPGLVPGSPLSIFAGTSCFRNGSCTGSPNLLTHEWIRLFMYKDPTLDLADLARLVTHETFVQLFHQSDELYHSFISTSDPDLGLFARRGGKIITWHGLSDEAIMPDQSRLYYDHVVALAAERKNKSRSTKGSVSDDKTTGKDREKSKEKTPTQDLGNVTDYYRLFLAPGVQHCGYGPGALPINVMERLRDWVEYGVAPDVLEGESFPDHTRYPGTDGETVDISGNQFVDDKKKFTRPVCMYPLVARYVGHGDPRRAENFECAESFF
ncbi:hypothetical protein A1O1_08949 [Capronia coronata CBS 617.96]|uniref:Carboxylic ester hydrolase n=1 Tax=Capronia coronata CBS 617.96 TaxID=1182541 RepID=W9XEC7_9EURO|nr:uncharacterized protein A1O1_08949 [Capronia coronata CBS 617.96]EXJ78548.1 hypothetical protein A1O1_08949 [Capronia coronata CBS 617.96]